MKFEAEIIKDIVDSRGHTKTSIHYQSECVEEWVKEVEGAYPKLCDYQPEWLNYSAENKIGVFPYATLTDITNATVENVVPYAYKRAILKGNTGYRDIDTGEILETFEEGRNLELVTVKMPVLTTTGKNLCKYRDNWTQSGLTFTNTENGVIVNGTATKNVDYYVSTVSKSINMETIELLNSLPVGTQLILSNNLGKNNYIVHTENGGENKYRPNVTIQNNMEFRGVFVRFEEADVCDNLLLTIQLEIGNKATPYEPYKTNILSTPSDLELRGIDDVKDELNCLTGELTQRIGEIVLNGSQNIDNDSDLLYYYLPFGVHNNISKSDKLPSINVDQIIDGLTGVAPQNRGDASRVYINIDGITTKEEMKNYFANNNVKIQYQLTTESVKTVDLSVVDQDGKTLEQIKPIEGTMLLNTSGETIKPLFSGEIPVEAITQNLASFIEE